ncbi:AraC family transcriptional regulator [Dryocola sp. BD613]|uniref:AraC family transcriptional regulator n=1 Tax=Dryocola sp. BD613 TaxID=3133272 RepID=UPI003F5097CA
MARYPIKQRFWRDAGLPWLEVRNVQDGRGVCYAPHTHETFSVGAVVGGTSTYLNEKTQLEIHEGSVVLMNPGVLHACNPVQDQPWAYRMFYFDSRWLNQLLGDDEDNICHFTQTWSTSQTLYTGLNRLYLTVTSPQYDILEKEAAAVQFMLRAQQELRPALNAFSDAPQQLARAIEKIQHQYEEPLTLASLAQAADLSVSHLIRLCQRHYGVTPHALLINRRLHIARERLKRGDALASVAQAVGFADQAHFQRAFKQHLAVTPGQYRDLL